MSYVATSGAGDVASAIWGGLKTGARTALDIQLEAARQRGASEAEIARIQAQMPAAGMPGWVLPVAIGGGALVLVLLLKGGKKETAVQNPRRRRRRR